MNMANRVPMTREGYDKLVEELRRLKTQERPKIVKEIEIARAHGDISENAEFHAAKERQSHIESRALQIEDRLARAQIIDANGSGPPPEEVRFGVTVVLLDSETDEEVTYTIVGEDESDAANGRISITSPIARALLGKSVDAAVTVHVPKGTREFEVREISVE